MKALYDFDINKLIDDFLPHRLRTPIVQSWLFVLLSAFLHVRVLFLELVEATLYDIGHNGQVCYFEAMLNDNFDNELRRIRIDDGSRYDRVYIYQQSELKPLYTYTRAENKPIYLLQRAEYGDSGFDFYIVLNGVVLTPSERARMRSLANYYKLTSMSYDIVG